MTSAAEEREKEREKRKKNGIKKISPKIRFVYFYK